MAQDSDEKEQLRMEWLRNPLTARAREDIKAALVRYGKELQEIASVSKDPDVRAASERVAAAVSMHKMLGGQ